MSKDEWISKLTSRKFWVTLCAFITNLVIAFGGAEQTAVQITGIIMAGAAVIAYILGEAWTDAAGVQAAALIAGEIKLPQEEPEKDKPPEEEQDAVV